MIDALALLGDPDPLSVAPELSLFAPFLGDWAVRNRSRASDDDPWIESERGWAFRSILGGRAIQDVIWRESEQGDRLAGGTSLRFLDPATGGWHVHWFAPAAPELCTLRARADGDGIELTGRQLDGRAIRWRFSGIRPDAFSWDGWCSDDDGASWWHEQHMDAERTV